MSRPAALRDRDTKERRLDDEAIRIGKDVIELLTTGMYVSPVTIYREYIQNAADSIDLARSRGLLKPVTPGTISIAFDHAARSVTIRDDGAGVPASEAVPVLLGIGGSSKRGSQARGFRGVGRLSGLAYCRELQFRTKAAGDASIVSITWDCHALRERLNDPSFSGDLRRIISDVVTIWYEEAEDTADHFFEVRISGAARLHGDMLLNEAAIGQYLAQVAPVGFAPEFSYGVGIETYLSAYGQRAPVKLTVAGQPVLRPFQDELVLPGTAHKLQIHDIEFLEFADVDGGVGAAGWIAHHEYVRSISPVLGVRGLRARFGNMQVGESSLFEETFKEPRFNNWTIGELHVFDRRIVPNARRDNFEVNHHFYNLLIQFGPLAARITRRCRTASVSRNAEQIVRNVIAEADRRLKQRRSFDRAELSRFKSSVLRASAKAKRIADPKTRRRLERKLHRIGAALERARPKKGASVVAMDEAAALVARLVTNREQARRLIEELQRLSG